MMKPARPDTAPRPGLMADVSASALSTGLLTFVISLSGPVVIYWQAAQAMGVDAAVFGTWIFAIFFAAGLGSLCLSLWYRAPMLVAWSAPGTILLIAVGPTLSVGEMVGAYLMVALALIVIGVSGLFERLVALVPTSVASGMLAGLLFQFTAQALLGLQDAPLIILVLPLVFLILQAVVPHLAIFGVLLTAILVAWAWYGIDGAALVPQRLDFSLTTPVFTWQAALSLAMPLLITTLTGQFLAGMTVLRAHGFPTPMRTILAFTGLLSLPAALFGGISTALASITMAIGASEEVDPDPRKRYVAGVASGVVFLLGATSVGALLSLMAALPAAFIGLVGGLALLTPMAKAFGDMLAERSEITAGVLTFLVASSGLSFAGIGAAFWSVVAGVIAVLVLNRGQRPGQRS